MKNNAKMHRQQQSALDPASIEALWHARQKAHALTLSAFAEHAARKANREKPQTRHQKQEVIFPSTRSIFQRDRDRVLHSRAFRRLKHKTQVFVAPRGDHFRTRLTHSLEVAQIARSWARFFGVDEDLTECIALSHDLGHPPFGHAGEATLDESMGKRGLGGFDHNDQSLRVVTSIERGTWRHGARQRGLNFSQAALEGLIKHNGPLEEPPSMKTQTIHKICAEHGIDERLHAPLEAQLASLADDVAYLHHDIEDALRAESLAISLDEIRAQPHFAKVEKNIEKAIGSDEMKSLRQRENEPFFLAELIRRGLNRMACDVIAETAKNLKKLDPKSANDIRHAGQPIADMSIAMKKDIDQLKAFSRKKIYDNWRVKRHTIRGRLVIIALFDHFCDHPETLPPEAQAEAQHQGIERSVADYIAGMTDNFAYAEYQRTLPHTGTNTGFDESV